MKLWKHSMARRSWLFLIKRFYWESSVVLLQSTLRTRFWTQRVRSMIQTVQARKIRLILKRFRRRERWGHILRNSSRLLHRLPLTRVWIIATFFKFHKAAKRSHATTKNSICLKTKRTPLMNWVTIGTLRLQSSRGRNSSIPRLEGSALLHLISVSLQRNRRGRWIMMPRISLLSNLLGLRMVRNGTLVKEIYFQFLNPKFSKHHPGNIRTWMLLRLSRIHQRNLESFIVNLSERSSTIY